MIQDLAQEYWEHCMETSPVTATALGDRRYDDRLGDVTPAGRAAHGAALDALAAKVEAVDAAGLSDEDAVTRGELLDALARDRAHVDCGLDEWTVSPMSGPQTFYMNIPDVTALRSEDEVAAYVERLGAMARQLGDITANTRRSLGEGKVSNRKAVERALHQLDTLLEQDAGEWRVLAHLAEVPAELAGTPGMEALGTKARARVDAELRPAFEAYRDLLREEILPAARPDETPGLMHVPGGAEAYGHMIRLHTTLELSAEEIHQIGLDEIAKVQDEITEVGARALGASTMPSLQQSLRADPELFFDTPEAIVARAEAAVTRAEERVPKYFGLRPGTGCKVRPIPAHEAPHSPIAYYRQPAVDGSRPGVYYVNTDAPTTRPRYEAEVLAFHEAVPGHHLQIDIAQKLEALPEFRRHAHVTSYVEGWALYTERLADEMSLYTGDLDRIGMLSFDLWRSARLVVDTGMHALGWSREEAIEYMVENTVLARNNIENEVDRYVVMPGQALSYKLGQLEIFRLRKAAKEKMRERFDLSGFHDTLLRHGAVSLGVLRQLVTAWSEA